MFFFSVFDFKEAWLQMNSWIKSASLGKINFIEIYTIGDYLPCSITNNWFML